MEDLLWRARAGLPSGTDRSRRIFPPPRAKIALSRCILLYVDASPMSIVPGFKHDIFISYAHVDNLPLADDDKGWVVDLHNTINTRLLQELRKDPAIWRDQGGLDGRVPDAPISAAIENSAVFLAVVSAAYLESAYCRKEAADFCGYRHPAFSLTPNGFSRVVVVTLTDDCPLGGLPEQLRTAPAVAFGETDEATGDVRRFVKPSRRDQDPYWHRIDHLIRHLVAVLRELQRGPSGGPEIAAPSSAVAPRFPVYLAEATDDLQEERTEVLALLRRVAGQAGSGVEPARSIIEAVSVQRACEDGLARAASSVHLINATSGRIWGDAGKPLAQMELETALRVKEQNRPLVWIPPDLKPDAKAAPGWLEFLTKLRAGKLSAETGDGRTPEVFEMPFDRFFGQLEARLLPPPANPGRQNRKKQPGATLVYVSYRAIDQAPVSALLEQLRNAKFAVARLDHGVAAADLAQRHETNLRYCDGLVVVYGHEGVGWAEGIALDARSRAHERNRPKKLGVLSGSADPADDFGIVDELVVTIRRSAANGFDGLDDFLAAIDEDAHG